MRDRATQLLSLPFVRFVISGGTVFVISFSLTAGLHAAGLPFQVGFVIAYAIAVSVHLTLHRHFTFAGHGEFALRRRSQAVRFAAVVVGQYLFIAVSVAVFAPLLDVPQIIVYLLAIAVMSICNYLAVATAVFHRRGHESEPPEVAPPPPTPGG